MSEWCSVEHQTGLSVYFCDPRSPWQRPTNEHTNGMLRRWLPKSTNLNIGQIPLSIIEDNLNLMPRRLHNWTGMLPLSEGAEHVGQSSRSFWWG